MPRMVLQNYRATLNVNDLVNPTMRIGPREAASVLQRGLRIAHTNCSCGTPCWFRAVSEGSTVARTCGPFAQTATSRATGSPWVVDSKEGSQKSWRTPILGSSRLGSLRFSDCNPNPRNSSGEHLQSTRNCVGLIIVCTNGEGTDFIKKGVDPWTGQQADLSRFCPGGPGQRSAQLVPVDANPSQGNVSNFTFASQLLHGG